MAVQLVTEESKRKGGTRLIRFTRNTSYRGPDGVTHDLGPDYEEDTAEVLAHEAAFYVTSGRAEYVEEVEEEAENPSDSLADDTADEKDDAPKDAAAGRRRGGRSRASAEG